MPRKLGRVASDQHTYIGGKVLELLRGRTVQTRLISRSGVGAIGTTESGCWVGLSDNIGLLLDQPGGSPVGFKLKAVSKFGEQAETAYRVWHGPHFDAPQVGLEDAPIGGTVLAARTLFAGEQSVNREFFNLATQRSGGPALTNWRCCLEASDSMARARLHALRPRPLPRGLPPPALLRPNRPRQRLDLVLARQSSPSDRRSWRARAVHEKACELEVAGGEEGEEADAAELLVGR